MRPFFQENTEGLREKGKYTLWIIKERKRGLFILRQVYFRLIKTYLRNETLPPQLYHPQYFRQTK